MNTKQSISKPHLLPLLEKGEEVLGYFIIIIGINRRIENLIRITNCCNRLHLLRNFALNTIKMNIQAQKIELAKIILATENKAILKQIKAFLNASKADWWDELSDAEKNSIEEGIAHAESGQLIPHEQVMKKVKSKFNL